MSLSSPWFVGQTVRENFGSQKREAILISLCSYPWSNYKNLKTNLLQLKGYSNEPVFASLSALIYQHTITALALPIKLVLPLQDLGGENGSQESSASVQMQQLLQLGAACNVFYLFSMDTDQLTGELPFLKKIFIHKKWEKVKVFSWMTTSLKGQSSW